MDITLLPTMEWHFFEKPNKLMITDTTFNNIVIAELDFNITDDFIIDAKSFDMIKKLNGSINVYDRYIEVFNQLGKYKCQKLDKEKPQLYLDDILYSNNYDSSFLKEATKFISMNQNNITLCGVLFNDNGDIFATDSFKFFYKRTQNQYNKFWSIPKQFIDLLPNDENVTIQFTNSKVIYNGEYKIYSSIYNNQAPAIEKICDNFISNNYLTINKKNELTFLNCEYVIINVKENELEFVFDDIEKQFKVKYDINTNFTGTYKISYDHFIQSFLVCEDQLFIEFNSSMIRINKKIIICCMR